MLSSQLYYKEEGDTFPKKPSLARAFQGELKLVWSSGTVDLVTNRINWGTFSPFSVHKLSQ